jgi:tRNA pseudouridine13 synthase
VTAQWVTAHKVAAQRVAALNPRLRGVRVGNFHYTDTELRLGMLAGNHFKVGGAGCSRGAGAASRPSLPCPRLPSH